MSTRTKEITNSENVIDSRDVIARIEALESDRGSYKVNHEEPVSDESQQWTANDGTVFTDDWTEDEEDEYQKLKALAEEAEGYAADWRYGEALINDSYFEDYARQTAEDLGLISDEDKWPCTCIDWEKAADELKQDYTSVDFDGTTFWIRS